MKFTLISIFFVLTLSSAMAAQTSVGSRQVDRIIGVCQLIENPPIPPLTAFNAMSPITSVWGYLQTVEKLSPTQLTGEMFVTAKATLLQGPEHGELKVTPSGSYRYYPVPAYLGIDRATIVVEMGDYKVKVVYHFKVGGEFGANDAYDSYEDKKNCPNGTMWKISLNPDDPNVVSYTYEIPPQLASAYASPTLRSSGTPQKRGAP